MSILNNPEQTYFDDNGNLLSNGWIYTYIPGTTTPKIAYLDEAQTIAASNPQQISAEGRVALYGTGSYRFIVQDSDHVQIYDAVTSSFLESDTISDAMLSVVQSPTITIAQQRLLIPDLIATAVAGVNLVTGPASTVPGPTGPIGPTGPAAGTVAVDVQTFTSSGTWTKPSSGQMTLIEIWGAGGAGTDAAGGGGGGGGGYASILVLTSALSGTVPVTIGAGGVFASGSAGPGAYGSDTSFGSVNMKGGAGGYLASDGITPVTGASGYLSSVASLAILQASYDYGYTPITSDGFGNRYGAYPFSGSPGGDINNPVPPSSIAGGSGGTYPSGAGSYPGGGGSCNGGNAASGKIVISTF